MKTLVTKKTAEAFDSGSNTCRSARCLRIAGFEPNDIESELTKIIISVGIDVKYGDKVSIHSATSCIREVHRKLYTNGGSVFVS